MASNTENLNLLMKNPSTDGADTFNVQTMLNENWQKIDNNAGTVAQTLANILKPTTPPIIGLPPSTTPDGMFQALGNTGELHVWRKTLKDSAGYTLGSAAQLENLFGGNTGGSIFRSSSSFSVSDDGTLSLLNEDSRSLSVSWEPLVSFLNSGFKGKYIICEGYPNSVYYIPQDAEYSLTGNYLNVSKAQLVSGYPAAYTTTYPVSTNPNAYQEGDDAKAAWYVLGDVVTGRFMLEGYFNSSHPTYYIADTKPTVTDDGVVSVNNVYSFNGYNGDKQQLQTLIRGKYIKCMVDDYTRSDFRNLGVVYIPEDTVVLQNSSVDGTYIDRYQPVTGYAAIPAGTTIEYLGKLGDKARVQVVSYVGTGTYGSSNPNSLTFDFVPKIVMIRIGGATILFDAIYGMRKVTVDFSSAYYVTVEWSEKTLSWYSTNDARSQMNKSGSEYYAIAIG